MNGMSGDAVEGREREVRMADEGGQKRARRAPKRYKESEIDFAAIREDFGSLRPNLMTVEEVLERLAEDMVRQHERGVTASQLAESMARRGLDVGEEKVWELLRRARVEPAA